MSVVDFSKLYPDNRQEGETVLRQAQLVMLRMLRLLIIYVESMIFLIGCARVPY